MTIESNNLCSQVINNLLTSDQSAYRAQHSIQTALLWPNVVDNWLYNITDGLHTTVCSFDIRKCFDTITHSILSTKMEKIYIIIIII